MFKTTIATVGAALLLTAGALAADPNSSATNAAPLEQFRSELRNVQSYATEVVSLSKSKRSSEEDVKAKTEKLAESIRRLRQLANEHVDDLGLAEERQKTIATATQVMEVISANKMKIFEEGSYTKNRNLVKAKAAGIVERVKIIEKNLGA